MIIRMLSTDWIIWVTFLRFCSLFFVFVVFVISLWYLFILFFLFLLLFLCNARNIGVWFLQVYTNRLFIIKKKRKKNKVSVTQQRQASELIRYVVNELRWTLLLYKQSTEAYKMWRMYFCCFYFSFFFSIADKTTLFYPIMKFVYFRVYYWSRVETDFMYEYINWFYRGAFYIYIEPEPLISSTSPLSISASVTDTKKKWCLSLSHSLCIAFIDSIPTKNFQQPTTHKKKIAFSFIDIVSESKEWKISSDIAVFFLFLFLLVWQMHHESCINAEVNAWRVCSLYWH